TAQAPRHKSTRRPHSRVDGRLKRFYLHSQRYPPLPNQQLATAETGRRGDRETGRQGDAETRRHGDTVILIRVTASPRPRVTASPRHRVTASPRHVLCRLPCHLRHHAVACLKRLGMMPRPIPKPICCKARSTCSFSKRSPSDRCTATASSSVSAGCQTRCSPSSREHSTPRSIE